MKDLNSINYSEVSKDLHKNEVKTHSELDHPNILKIFKIYTTSNNVYIITELCDRDDLAKVL